MIYHHAENKSTYSLDDLDITVRKAARTLREHLGEFDSIVAQGTSGIVVAAPVSLILQKELSIVRKPHDGSHQQRWYADPETRGHVSRADVIGVKSIAPGKRVLFLDDTIASGETRARVAEVVRAEGGSIVATYLYETDSYEGRSL